MDLSVIAIAVGLLAYVFYAVYSSPAAGKAAASAPSNTAETATQDEPPIPAEAEATPVETAAEELEPATAEAGETVTAPEPEATAETAAETTAEATTG